MIEIEKELLAEKNSLYGRAIGIYKMTAMGFYDAVKFFPDYSDREKVLAYSILGGTRLSEISQKSLVENTMKTSVYLKNLIDLGIVIREIPVNAEIRRRATATEGSIVLQMLSFASGMRLYLQTIKQPPVELVVVLSITAL